MHKEPGERARSNTSEQCRPRGASPTQSLHRNIFALVAASNNHLTTGKIEAPRVGLEPTTNGLTVTPRPSVQSECVAFGVVLSMNSDQSSHLVLSCPGTYGYTNGYTRSAGRSPSRAILPAVMGGFRMLSR